MPFCSYYVAGTALRVILYEVPTNPASFFSTLGYRRGFNLIRSPARALSTSSTGSPSFALTRIRVHGAVLTVCANDLADGGSAFTGWKKILA